MTSYIEDNILEYPYYNLVYKLDKIKFNQLIENYFYVIKKNMDESIIRKKRLKTYNGDYLFIKENWKLNEELNNITDLFTEKHRILCNFKNYETPFEYWNKNKEKIKEKISDDKFQMREYIYNHTKLCNNFRISVALAILNIFNAKKWLDISAGWGDRLIAAIIHNVDYYFSVDPNASLHKEYPKIIDTLVDFRESSFSYRETPNTLKISKDKFQIKLDGFEEVKLPDIKFDLVFSSPPFFDLEIYSDSEKDSYQKYKNEDEWYNNFLLFCVNKAINALEIGGHLVLYIDNTNGNKLISDINIHYCGQIYYYYPESLIFRGMYVWKKIN